MYPVFCVTSVSVSGPVTGVVIILCVSGVLCNSDFLGGWPSVFYVTGKIERIQILQVIAFLKYTRAPQTVHNTPVMNILKGYFYIILF